MDNKPFGLDFYGPEPGFDPEHNRRVINRTIKNYERMQKKRRKEFSDQVGERSEAIASYLTSPKGAAYGKSVDRYFGKRILSHLRGERLVDRLRERVKLGPGARLPYHLKGRMISDARKKT